MRVACLLLAICFFISSCMSSTVIDSIPSNAHIFIDGEYVGKTPYIYSDMKVAASETYLLIKKEGYEDLETLMFRDEKFDVASCGGALFFVVPVLWIMGYDSQHNYKLQPTPELIEKQKEEEEKRKAEEEQKRKDQEAKKDKVEPEKKQEEKARDEEDSEEPEDSQEDEPDKEEPKKEVKKETKKPVKEELPDEEDIDK